MTTEMTIPSRGTSLPSTATGSYAPVTGRLDGKNPMFDESGLWREHGKNDVFWGDWGLGKIVPKVNDHIRDPLLYITWRVTYIDPVTFIPGIEEIRPYGSTGNLTEDDKVFGVGVGVERRDLRVYVNKASTPYNLFVDPSFFVGGSMLDHAIVFLGGVVEGSEAKPISMVFDNSGNFISHKIPLELVGMDNHTGENIATKVCKEARTTVEVSDGELVTVVYYSAGGVPLTRRQMLVEVSTYVHASDIAERYITHLSIDSPWVTAADKSVLRFPLNIPRNALDLVGVVHYSDGSRLPLPVDGKKFTLDGASGYTSSIPEEVFHLSLRYSLSKGEASYAGLGILNNGQIAEPFKLITTEFDPGYTVKLFMYPYWDTVVNQYRLRFWLLDLKRTTFTEVTQHIVYSSETGAFEPTLYGYAQRKRVSLNLARVSGSYKPMTHIQTFTITLFSPPHDSDTPWKIMNQLSPAMPEYGESTLAARIGSNKINLAAGRPTLEDWLQSFYYQTYPLNSRHEVKPPKPVSFELSVDNGATWLPFMIDNWNKDITVPTLVSPDQNVYSRFTVRQETTSLYLNLAALTVR